MRGAASLLMDKTPLCQFSWVIDLQSMFSFYLVLVKVCTVAVEISEEAAFSIVMQFANMSMTMGSIPLRLKVVYYLHREIVLCGGVSLFDFSTLSNSPHYRD
jgi:hypothetical protein